MLTSFIADVCYINGFPMHSMQAFIKPQKPELPAKNGHGTIMFFGLYNTVYMYVGYRKSRILFGVLITVVCMFANISQN